MANPQPTDAHIRIAHSIEEQLMVSLFSEQQRRILDLILRLSWGCGKKYAVIPHQADFEIVAVGKGHIKTHLDWLITSKVIIREGQIYAFNKNFDQWHVSRALAYTSAKMAGLVKMNLEKPDDEKANESIKKVTEYVTNCKDGKVTEYGTIENPEVTENGTETLRNTEREGYGKRNIATPDLASPKETLNKSKERTTSSSDNNTTEERGLLGGENLPGKVLKIYRENTGDISDDVVKSITVAVKKYKETAVIDALAIAKDKGKDWNYVLGILRKWETAGTLPQPASPPSSSLWPGDPPATDTAIEAAWQQITQEIQHEISSTNFSTWFKDLKGICITAGDLLVGAPNTFVADYLSQNQMSFIERVVVSVLKQPYTVRFCVVREGNAGNIPQSHSLTITG